MKIVAVTASGFESKRSDVLAAGLDDYLRKPYRPDEIFDCMARHLGVHYRRAETASVRREPQAAELNPDAVAALPAALRLELRSALIALDANRISQIVEKVAEHDAGLAAVLSRYTESFTYTPILLAVDTGAGDSRAMSD